MLVVTAWRPVIPGRTPPLFRAHGGRVSVIKRVLLGRPLPSAALEEERLRKVVALPVFSSDAISSTAYATEEILFVTAVGASSLALALSRLVPIAIAVAVLLAIVITSYRQLIFAYPGGGGAYVVSRENLGEMPSLVAAASLLVDYILTVAVSVSAGVAAIVSIPAFHDLRDHRVALGLSLVALVTLANLRGVRESGRIFAVPTYLYIAGLAALVAYGLIRTYFGDVGRIEVDPADFDGALAGGTLGLFIVLKGFSSGAVALTGIEAISNAVPAFRRPEPRNAATTLVWMGVILGTLFFGTALLSYRLGPYPTEDQTVIAQLGLQVFGNGPVFVFLQFATAVILVLAANTAYAGFPRLSSIVARDGFLPRQLANLGDRLVFSNGVLLLALAAGGLLVAFGGITNALIPLYAVGVFTSFTLAQAGMVRHHRHERARGWKRNQVINGVGAAATLGVLLVVAVTKFSSGAWLPLVVIPAFVVLFKAIHRHYTRTAAELAIPSDYHRPRMNHTMVVLVAGMHRGVLQALAYARSLNPNFLVAVNVVGSEEDQEELEKQWTELEMDVPLEFVHSPYRELTRPLLDYLDELDARYQNDTVTVVIPEFVVKHWWGHLLHNQSALVLKGRLLFRRGTVVTSVPYHLR
jgi:amino acid transporter